jgi:hypothetical protein
VISGFSAANPTTSIAIGFRDEVISIIFPTTSSLKEPTKTDANPRE